MVVSNLRVTSEHARRFREEGFFVLKGILPTEELDTLRGECQRLIDARDREMDRLGVDKLDLDHRGSRYFLHAYDDSPAVERFLCSDLMAQVAQAALGDTVLNVPAGSIACFSSTLLHRSGPNTTDRMRRVYVAQYSAEPILNEDGSQPRMLAEPLLVDGRRVT